MCFVEITNLSADGTVTRLVYDAFEGKEYGNYITSNAGPKSLYCQVRLPSGESKGCKSDYEFTELVKVYMEGGR